MFANKKSKEEELTKAVAKKNVYLKKIYKELGINPPLNGQEASYKFCERISFDWFVELL